MKQENPLRMVAGGRALSSAVHRIAAPWIQQINCLRRLFRPTPSDPRPAGAELFLPPNRCYGAFEENDAGRAQLHEAERMDFVAIVPQTPAFPASKMRSTRFHVLSDQACDFQPCRGEELAEMVRKPACSTV